MHFIVGVIGTAGAVRTRNCTVYLEVHSLSLPHYSSFYHCSSSMPLIVPPSVYIYPSPFLSTCLSLSLSLYIYPSLFLSTCLSLSLARSLYFFLSFHSLPPPLSLSLYFPLSISLSRYILAYNTWNPDTGNKQKPIMSSLYWSPESIENVYWYTNIKWSGPIG